MSFAAFISRASSDIKHQLDAEIDAWVSEQVDNVFKPACQEAASKGATSVHCTSDVSIKASSMSLAFVNQQGVLDEFTKCFHAKISALGFAACYVESGSHALHWVDAHQQWGYKWSLKASWPRVSMQEEAPQRLPSGTSAECPVCLAFTNVVALFPCVHTMCSACAGRVVRSACPSCRQRVTCVSQGLFLG